MEEENKVPSQEPVETVSYTKEIILPSNGYLGGPSKVTIRAMTTAEEKILYSSRDFSFINKICKACTIRPKDLDLSTLTAQDLQFMLFQIREVTFGPTYKQPIRCPFCGMSQEAEINIADFTVEVLDKEELAKKLFIELPISKVGVHLRLLSQQEIDNIESEAQKLFNDGLISDPDSHAMVKKITAMIESVVGKEFENENDKFSYVNKLHMADFNAIRNALDKIKFGLDNSVEVICENKNCNRKVEVLGTICPEFFRPTI